MWLLSREIGIKPWRSRMNGKIKTTIVVICFIAGIMLIYSFGYFEGKESIKSFGNSIRFISSDNQSVLEYIPLFYNDGSLAYWEVTLLNGSKTFVNPGVIV